MGISGPAFWERLLSYHELDPVRSFIPDQHMVFCPEQLLRVILAHIHYMPDHWQGNAHRSQTRDEFAQLFQYKAVSGVGVRAC